MSNDLITRSVGIVEKAKEQFIKRNKLSLVDFEDERSYAIQAMMNNEYLAKTALNDAASLVAAVSNIASVGLSLNPVTQYAYLVPRDGRVVLDISYKGLLQIATDTGSIMWGRADLVYKDDTFVYKGPAEKPEHIANVFGDRGEFVGCYSIAKTADGDILTEVMSAEEVHKVRDKSMLYDRKKSGPWVEWFGEMAKKTIIKRASKTWPKTDLRGGSERLSQAISVINQHEGFNDIDNGQREQSDETKKAMEAAINDCDIDAIRDLYDDAGGRKSLAFKSLAPIYKGKAKDLLIQTSVLPVKDYFACALSGDTESAIDIVSDMSDDEKMEACFLQKGKDRELHEGLITTNTEMLEAG